MSLRALLLLLVGIAVVAFVGVNWQAMNTPTDLSLIVAQIHAPLGLIMLGLLVGVSAVFVAIIAYMQGTVLAETRRHAKELAAQRDLADKAEASRFTDLRAYLDQEMARMNETLNNVSRETLSRVDRAEMGLRERPVDADIARLVEAVEGLNRDLHSRIDRLEMGLGDRLTHQPLALQAPPVVAPAAPAVEEVDPVGNAVPR
ncbi:MAG: LapA family protein [Comamonadaceae bacterium]|nr:LapA family protein [Comamonadaceae bacterium]RRD55794.1 LapA family protein [Comamonadaceae bacterium OH2545_COT-014]